MHKPVSIMGYYEARSFKRHRRQKLINTLKELADLALAIAVLMMIVWIEFKFLDHVFFGGAS